MLPIRVLVSLDRTVICCATTEKPRPASPARAASMEEFRESFRKKLESVYDVMHNGGYPQINGAIQDILPEILSADEVYSEVPFTYKEEGTIWNGIIDLIYRKAGKLHIIDWKTNRNDEGLAEHYKDQLDAYKKATKEITGESAKYALIYHISIEKGD